MIALYSRDEVRKDEVNDMIRREFLARIFDEDTERPDQDADETSSEVIAGLLAVRRTLLPKVETIPDMTDVDELWRAEYTKEWTKRTGSPVPEGQGWFPDCLPQSNLYTRELVKHLAQLDAEYDHAWTKAMAKVMQEEEAKQGG